MGKKYRRNPKPGQFSDQGAEHQTEDNAAFAQSLLSDMSLDSDANENVQLVDESAFEETDEPAVDFETRHPHLSSIHKGLSKVFRKDSTKTDSDSNSAAVSCSESEFYSTSEPRFIPKNSSMGSPSSSAKDRDMKAPSPADRSEQALKRNEQNPDDAVDDASESGVPGKRRNRRKEKLAERERERARIVREAQAEAETDVDKKAIELQGMGMMITKAGLVEHEVQPDGHCLFHSLCDQLLVRRGIEVSVTELRKALADYIREHPDDFVPYLIEDESGDVVDVDKYTADLENTPLWGGDLEIMAASCLYETPIRIHFGSQAPLDINEEKFIHVDSLHLAFYQAKFGLGAHYNSLRDVEDKDGGHETHAA